MAMKISAWEHVVSRKYGLGRQVVAKGRGLHDDNRQCGAIQGLRDPKSASAVPVQSRSSSPKPDLKQRRFER